MTLRDYYNNKFGKDFYLFYDFVKSFGQYDLLTEIISVKKEEYESDYYKDPDSLLYDYLLYSLMNFSQKGEDVKYNFSFLYDFFGRDFLNLFLRKEGEELFFDDNIYTPDGVAIDIYNEVALSEENYDDLNFHLNITNDDNFKYLDKYLDLKGGEYIKREISLSKIRKFISLDGNGAAFYDCKNGSYLEDIFSMYTRGVFNPDDRNNFFANSRYYENIFYYDYDWNV
jgi:hypothetical protein